MREKRTKNCIVILLTGIFFTVCFAVASSAALETKKEEGKKHGKIMARVNGQPVYEEALTPFVKREMKKFRKFGPKKDTTALEKRIQKRALNEAISNELLIQESQKMEIKDIEKKIDDRINALKEKYQTEEQFRNMLKAKELGEKDLRNNMRRSIYIDEYLIKQGIRNPAIPDEKVREFYEKSKNSFKREESVRVSHILIKVDEKATDEEKAEARKKAEKIRQEIKDGRDFAEMAKEYSQDGTAPGGGDLGYIKRKYMPQEFDEVAFSLQKGELSDVVETRHGYHIIMVYEKRPAGVTPYEDLKDFLTKYMQEQVSRENLVSHIKELRKKAKIEILINES